MLRSIRSKVEASRYRWSIFWIELSKHSF